MSYYHPIHFSLAEAQTLLQEIVPSLTRMQELKQQLDAKGYDLRMHRYFDGLGANGLKAFPDQMEELIRLYKELSTRGVLLKDIDKGLIDFPTIRNNGEEVYLCYMLGEPEIRYWHHIDDGFSGRRDLDTL